MNKYEITMELTEIHQTLKSLFLEHVPPLQVTNDSEQGFEIAGTKEAMQGKQKVKGYYFGSIVPKPKDIRLYFFPIYTDPDQFELSPELKKMLKGKSCFHIKKLNDELIGEIRKMMRKAIKIYQEKGLV